MLQVDQHRVVVKEIGVVRQALRQVPGQDGHFGVPQRHGHHGQLGTFEVKAGTGGALRVNGHDGECG